MQYQTVIDKLKSIPIPVGWRSNLFLMPEAAMSDIYQYIVSNKCRNCLELGTGWGSTACVIAGALDEIGGGSLTTVDRWMPEPINVRVLKETVGLTDNPEIVVDPQGYNWWLADLIDRQTKNGRCEPIFDFCLLDGAHEWEPDALAFYLVAKLLKPGATLVLDDINYSMRLIPTWPETHGHLSDRELDAQQVGMVYELAVRQHPDFTGFQVTHDGRIGWAQKVRKKPWPFRR